MSKTNLFLYFVQIVFVWIEMIVYKYVYNQNTTPPDQQKFILSQAYRAIKEIIQTPRRRRSLYPTSKETFRESTINIMVILEIKIP